MQNQKESKDLHSTQPVIHRGPWVITDSAAAARGFHEGIIEDGALVIADGLIKAIGKYRDIAKSFCHYPTREYESTVLAPALINGHCHLELSYLDRADKIHGHGRYNGDLTTWIRDFLTARESFSQDTAHGEELILNHTRKTLHQISGEGVAFVGDVGNSLVGRLVEDEQSARVCFLLELLGLTKESEMNTFARLEKITATKSSDVRFTAHAPYSTTPALIQAIKKRAEQKSHIFSIHVAESKQEVEFLQSGTGVFKEFLRERGAWDGSFTIPGMGSVQYLESLGVINAKTLCVHGVHVDQAEMEILAKKKAKVCLCPGSNRFLGVGKAPVTEYLAHGILPALGTDSKASNSVLNMWREMRLLREDHPSLLPESVFAMATRGGAEAWGVASEMGTLEPGKRALVLAINCKEKIYATNEVFEYLTTAGESIQVEWLKQIQDGN
jgi:cytosine/adenosine deaminase-related metal-dependent hydrolase